MDRDGGGGGGDVLNHGNKLLWMEPDVDSIHKGIQLYDERGTAAAQRKRQTRKARASNQRQVSRHSLSKLSPHIPCTHRLDQPPAYPPWKTLDRTRKRESSPVGAHLHAQQHQFEYDNISVLDRDNSWFQRGVMEAIHIAANNPTLHRDWGRPCHRCTTPSLFSHMTRVRPVVVCTELQFTSSNITAEEDGRSSVESSK